MYDAIRSLSLGLLGISLFCSHPARSSTEFAEISDLKSDFSGVWLGTPPKEWDPYFRLAGLTFGVHWDGDDSFGKNLEVRFMPASTSKVFTAGYALDVLGTDYRFETRLEYSCLENANPCRRIADLVIVGSGDPTWGRLEFGESSSTERLASFARKLRESGVEVVEGGVSARASDPRFNGADQPTGWQQSDYTSSYGAPGRAFNVGTNYAGIEVTGPTSARWVNGNIPNYFDINLQKGRKTALSSVDHHRGSDGRVITVLRGTWNGRKAQWSLPVFNTGDWVERIFASALQKSGIRNEPRTSSQSARKEILRFYSKPLSKILIPFLKESDNFLGDTIWKAAAVRSGGSDDNLYDAARTGVSSHFLRVADRLSIPITREYVDLRDGSGLSRESRVTPRVLTSYLQDFKNRPEFQAFWNAIPIAGVDGTLRSRMRKTVAAGVVHAKTGTLHDVSNLAGLIPSKNGTDYLPFVVLSKAGKGSGTGTSRAVQDKVVVELTREYRN